MNESLKLYVKLFVENYVNKNKPYESFLTDDEGFKETSVIVPDDIKEKIFNYLTSMGLSRR